MEAISFDALTPMATSGLAIGLAYLKLNRFRYRESVQDRARKGLLALERQDGTLAETQGDTEYYIRLKTLSSWSGLRALSGGSVLSLPLSVMIYSLIYAPRFRSKSGLDRIFSGTLVVGSGLFLILGRAFMLDIIPWNWLGYIFHVNMSNIWWLLLSACIVLPIFFTILGDHIEFETHEFIDHTIAEFTKIMTNATRKARLPN